MPQSPLVAYYHGRAADHAGRRLRDVLAWDDDALEDVHDYVQWLFPSREPSRANSAAPVLTDEDAATFRGDPALQAALQSALERMLRFYGFRRVIVEGGVRLERADNWTSRARVWLQPHNHNHLRLTRIMKSLAALGRGEDARALQRELLAVAEQTHPGAVSRSTAFYWRTALPE